MAKGVAEVEQRAVALLAFVAGDDFGLHRAAGHHRTPQSRRCESAHGAPLGFEPGKKSSITNEAVFDDLGVAGEKLATRQTGQSLGVREDEARLIESPDQVLANAGVDPGLAADRAVDLS